MAPILKCETDDEEGELEFELDYLALLTVEQRFELMFKKSAEIKKILLDHGHRKPFEIIKRA